MVAFEYVFLVESEFSADIQSTTKIICRVSGTDIHYGVILYKVFPVRNEFSSYRVTVNIDGVDI